MTWFIWLVFIVAMLSIAPVGLTAVGSMRRAALSKMLTARLEAGRCPPTLARYDPSESMLAPLAGEVAWTRPRGRKVYFKGPVTQLSYEFAP